jgi:hypothetical protein
MWWTGAPKDKGGLIPLYKTDENGHVTHLLWNDEGGWSDPHGKVNHDATGPCPGGMAGEISHGNKQMEYGFDKWCYVPQR